MLKNIVVFCFAAAKEIRLHGKRKKMKEKIGYGNIPRIYFYMFSTLR